MSVGEVGRVGIGVVTQNVPTMADRTLNAIDRGTIVAPRAVRAGEIRRVRIGVLREHVATMALLAQPGAAGSVDVTVLTVPASPRCTMRIRMLVDADLPVARFARNTIDLALVTLSAVSNPPACSVRIRMIRQQVAAMACCACNAVNLTFVTLLAVILSPACIVRIGMRIEARVVVTDHALLGFRRTVVALATVIFRPIGCVRIRVIAKTVLVTHRAARTVLGAQMALFAVRLFPSSIVRLGAYLGVAGIT